MAADRSNSTGFSAHSPYPESLRRVMEEFARLPGIGPRSAERMAFHLLKAKREDALRLASAIQAMKQHVRHCSICYNLTEHDLCPICRNPGRDAGVVLVVEQPKDLLSLEQTGMYVGTYHVLMGHIAPLEGIGPEDLTVDRLLERIDQPQTNAQGAMIREVVFGLSPNLEGDGTVLYLSELLRDRPQVHLTRLARGLPSGSSLEFASKAVLADAIVGRQDVSTEAGRDGGRAGAGTR